MKSVGAESLIRSSASPGSKREGKDRLLRPFSLLHRGDIDFLVSIPWGQVIKTLIYLLHII